MPIQGVQSGKELMETIVHEYGNVRLGILMALAQSQPLLLNVDFDEVIAIKLCDVGLLLSRTNNKSIVLGWCETL
jgi:hypothetical protein